MIAIIGAGLTGLSLAYHLKKGSYELFEQGEAPGGLCRSVRVDGFTFDYTGHLLHLKHPSLRRFVHKIVPDTFVSIQRNAAVYCQGTFLPYPFQANTYGLPREVVYECVMGFLQARLEKKGRGAPADFRGWALQTFGEGIAKYFFIPYNEKLWQMDLRKLTADWVSWSIPQPSLQEVVQGALGIRNVGMGYNASFLYPRTGGINVLPDALARGVGQIQLLQRLQSINLSARRLTFHDGQEASYDTLVSTMPLHGLLAAIKDLPARYKAAIRKLRSVSVHNINVGVNRSTVSPYHWIYFPEPEFPFYRVGFYSNFTAGMAPRGTSSLYIEVAHRPEVTWDRAELEHACLEGLKRCGILKRGDRLVASHYVDIPCAYVVYDAYRRQHLPAILSYLKQRQVISAGRYGSWVYASMQDALLQGRQIAESLK